MTWIETYSGKRFDLLDPQAEQVDLADIAHALARLNRFTGHTSVSYSVAEHAMHVEWVVSQSGHAAPLLSALALHHDSAEAYVGDASAPLKWAMRELAPGMGVTGFDRIALRAETAILKALSLPEPTDEQEAIIKRADLTLLAAERKVFMPNTGAHEWNLKEVPSAELLNRLRDPYFRHARVEQIADRFLGLAKNLLTSIRAG
jgi:hypothetical protein